MNQPINKPSNDDLFKAIKILNDYRLHYYQLMWFHQPKLTQPGKGYPFHTSINPEQLGCISVEFMPDKSYNFWISSSEDDQSFLTKCNTILTAYRDKRTKIESHACCPLATFRNCVCMVSFDCQVHGVKCVGTHD